VWMGPSLGNGTLNTCPRLWMPMKQQEILAAVISMRSVPRLYNDNIQASLKAPTAVTMQNMVETPNQDSLGCRCEQQFISQQSVMAQKS
jgi:hypothetical protein